MKLPSTQSMKLLRASGFNATTVNTTQKLQTQSQSLANGRLSIAHFFLLLHSHSTTTSNLAADRRHTCHKTSSRNKIAMAKPCLLTHLKSAPMPYKIPSRMPRTAPICKNLDQSSFDHIKFVQDDWWPCLHHPEPLRQNIAMDALQWTHLE